MEDDDTQQLDEISEASQPIEIELTEREQEVVNQAILSILRRGQPIGEA
jgi:hypothetical protein